MKPDESQRLCLFNVEPTHRNPEVIFANDSMIVINKPADLAMDEGPFLSSAETANGTNSTETSQRGSVLSWCEQYMKEKNIFDSQHAALEQSNQRKKQLKFVHQLDYATSGVLCLAFNKDTAATVSHCFDMRTANKWYIALVKSNDEEEEHEDTNLPVLHANAVSALQEGKQSRMSMMCSFLHRLPGNLSSGGLHSIRLSTEEERQSCVCAFELSFPMQIPSKKKEVQCFVEGACPDGRQKALSSATFDFIQECFKTHTMLTIDLPIMPDESDSTGFRMCVDFSGEGGSSGKNSKAARTSVLVLEKGYAVIPEDKADFVLGNRAPKSLVTKLLLIPHTGRRHQLRLHTWALGWPILGDMCYTHVPHPCFEKKELVNSCCWPRMCLHAWRLVLPIQVEVNTAETAITKSREEKEKRRVEGRKRRRREVLGLEDAVMNARASNQWADFGTCDPFERITSQAENLHA